MTTGGGDFAFQINFDWSKAASSTKAFFTDVEAALQRIAAGPGAAEGYSQFIKQLEARVAELGERRTEYQQSFLKRVGRTAEELGPGPINQATLSELTGKQLLVQQQYLKALAENVDTLAQNAAIERKTQVQKQAGVDRLLASDEAYITATRDAAVNLLRRKVAEEERLAGDTEYIQSQRQLATLQKQRATAENEELASSRSYIAATRDAEVSRRRLSAIQTEAVQQFRLAGLRAVPERAPSPWWDDPEARRSFAEESRVARNVRDATLISAEEQKRLNQVIGEQKGGLEAYAKTIAEGKVAQTLRNQLIKTATAAEEAESEQLAKAIAAERVARRQRTAKIAIAEVELTSAGLIADEAKANILRKNLTAQRVIAETNLLLGNEQEITLQAQRINAEKQLNAVIQKRAVELAGAGPASTFQRFQQSLAARRGEPTRAATEYQTLPQFLSSKLLTTAGFAVSGALFYGAFQGLTGIVQETRDLEQQLALINVQLRQAGQEDQFADIRRSIIETAKASGIAASDLAFLSLQLRGAFSEEVLARGIGFFEDQLTSASRIARVTGLPLDEITDSLTGLAKTFDIEFEEIGDTAVGLQQRFGVLARETIQFTADLAPVAEEVGVTFEELAAVGAVAQRASGRSGAALAEAFGRVLPAVQESAVDIITVLREIGDPVLLQNVTRALTSGRAGSALIEIAQAADRFTPQQRELLLNIFGGRREAQAIAPLFDAENARALRRELDGSINDTGALNEQFDELRTTAAQTFAELRQQAIQLGVALLNSGIIQALTEIGKALSVVFKNITALIQPFTDLVNLADSISGGRASGILGLLGLGAAGVAFARRGGAATSTADRAAAAFAATQAATAGSAAGEQYGATSMAANINAYSSSFFASLTTFIRRNPIAAGIGITALSAVAGEALGSDLIGQLGSAVGVGVLTGSALTGGILAGATIISGFLESVRTAKEQEEALRTEFADLTSRELSRIAARGEGSVYNVPGKVPLFSDIVNPIAELVSGVDVEVGPTREQVAADVLESRAIEDYRILLKQVLNEDIPDGLRKGIREVLASDAYGFDFDYLSTLYSDILNAITSGQINIPVPTLPEDKAEEILRTGAPLDIKDKEAPSRVLRNLEDAEKSFEAGAISYNELRTALENTRASAISTLQAALASGATGSIVDETGGLLADVSNRLSTLTGDVVRKRVDLLLETRRLAGEPTGLAEVEILLAALQDPALTGEDNRADVLRDIYDALGQELQLRIDSAGSAAEKLAIASAGIAVPDIAIFEAVRQQVVAALETSAISRVGLEVAAANIGLSYQELTYAIAVEAVNAGISLRQAAINVVNGVIAAYEQLIDAAQEVTAEIAAAANELTKLYGIREQLANAEILEVKPVYTPVVRPTLAPYQRAAANEAASAARQAESAARQAQADAERAAREREQFARTLRALDKEHTEASLELWFESLNASRDPIESAQRDIAYAQAALRFAEWEADRMRAQAQLIRANRALGDAVFDAQNAQIELLVAVAESGGDLVESARLQELLAARRAFVAGLSGAGPAEMARLQADLERSRAALRDAQLNEQLETIRFQREVGEISTQQAVALLETILSQADVLKLTEQQRRDLILEIRRLREELSSDLQFNLPSEIRLPTLYEARRLNQGGTQDNRQITVNVQANTNADPGEIASAIAYELDRPPRFGARSRIY